MSAAEFPIPDEQLDALRRGEVLRWTLSRKRPAAESASDLPERLSGRLIESGDGHIYQTAIRRGKQEFHENRTPAAAAKFVQSLFGTSYRQLNLHGRDADFELQAKSEGRVKLKHRKPSLTDYQTSHDRSKQYLLPEDEPIPFLIEAGLMTERGKLKSAGRAKFRQINRYLEFLKDILPEMPTDRPLQIVDFGCGKSYLTFALHHWLTRVERREAEIVGLDREPGAIAHCNAVTRKLSLEHLRFEQGEIAGYQPEGPVDLVISLHACDTATDDALIQAVAWEAKVILAVPCCQHELFPQLENASLEPLLEHGILKERFTAMATDALRALALQANGYRTQIVEFIDMEHTPKNIMIRAVRESGEINQQGKTAFERFRQTLGGPAVRIQRLIPR